MRYLLLVLFLVALSCGKDEMMSEEGINTDPKMCVLGNLNFNGAPVRYSKAEAKTMNKFYTSDEVRQDGAFIICPIPAGDLIELTFYDLCGDTLATLEIPPSDITVDLDQIELNDVPNKFSLNLTNCFGEPLTNGHVLYKGQSFNVTEGSVQITDCNEALNSEAFIHDLDLMKTATIDLNSNHEFNNIVCGEVKQYAIFKSCREGNSFSFDTIEVLKYKIVEDIHSIYFNIGEPDSFPDDILTNPPTGVETYPLQVIDFKINSESSLPSKTTVKIHPFKIRWKDINGKPTLHTTHFRSINDYELEITNLIQTGNKTRLRGYALGRQGLRCSKDSIIFDLITSD